jgi:ankyrin repeat protein
MIEPLLDAGAHQNGRRALCIAAKEDRIDVATLLLERGSDINEIPDNDDINDLDRTAGVRNPLCEAAWQGKAAVLEFLLERGADAGIRDTMGRSALELAEMRGHESCVKVLNTWTRR